jgi:hypothetical protein
VSLHSFIAVLSVCNATDSWEIPEVIERSALAD